MVSVDRQLSSKLIEGKVMESCSRVNFPTSRLFIFKSQVQTRIMRLKVGHVFAKWTPSNSPSDSRKTYARTTSGMHKRIAIEICVVLEILFLRKTQS